MSVLGNMNIHPVVAPPAVHEQSIGTATVNSSVEPPGDAYSDSGGYCSQLLRRGRGFPLYVPGPQRNLPREYQRQGVTIGDVGRVTPEGIFDFFFNIYLDGDDPYQRGERTGGLLPVETLRSKGRGLPGFRVRKSCFDPFGPKTRSRIFLRRISRGGFYVQL
ncbi:hypothetical protein DFH09DRAFT_508310 [Mycena vulgaris]|nr:hypothetical protein DFH09DRAFT_508310 [Mycena vulgaris]